MAFLPADAGCAVTILRSCDALPEPADRRSASGVSPKNARNRAVKWLWLAKPVSSGADLRGRPAHHVTDLEEPALVERPAGDPGVAHSTSRIISISTGILFGSSAIPTAERACLPIASP